MSFFPKLEAVGAIYREPQGVFVHCGLEIPESLVQRGQSQVSFVSKIFEPIFLSYPEGAAPVMGVCGTKARIFSVM